PRDSGSRIQPRNSELIHWRLRSIRIGCLRVVLEISKSEVRQPVRTNGFRKSAGQTVIMDPRTAIQSSRSKTSPTESAEAASAGQIEVVKAEAPKNLVLVRCAVVYTCVKRILIERARTRRHEIIVQARWCRRRPASHRRCGKQRQYIADV